MGVSKGTVCLGSAADCSDSKDFLNVLMGRDSTFKKRRHSYKGALALEIRVRGIVTNFVVYYRIELQLASCIANLSLKRIARALHMARIRSNPSKKFSTRVYTAVPWYRY